MKIIIVVDNSTLIDRYFIGEPGFSAYVEDGDTRILFDLGYSDVFLRNALKMNIALSELDAIAVSHGHCDHTGGLEPLMRYYADAEFERRSHKRPVVFAHPETFKSISADGFSELGSMISADKLSRFFDLSVDRLPQKITDRLLYLGEIPRKTDFEGKLSFGKKEGKEECDYVPEDTALVYRSAAGLVIITGCSHAGICNIVEYAKAVTGIRTVADIIGGFHLLDPDEQQMAGTIRYFENQHIKQIHPCHCTDLDSRIKLSAVCPVKEVGVGLELEYE